MDILVSKVLPAGEKYQLVHVHNHPKRSRSLIYTSKNDKHVNLQSSHLFILEWHGIPLLALEIIIYESPDALTLYISKADTSGYYNGPKFGVGQVIQKILIGLLEHYSSATKLIRICVFAYSQPEYLFLGSKDNPNKHVLSDSQLVRWWIKCLDGLKHTLSQDTTRPIKACLRVPGESQIERYLPGTHQLNWTHGDIFWYGSDQEADEIAMAVKRIPRFPDDPKTRFLESIYLEKRSKKVSRRQFWLELPSRQEFRLNRSMGIIGVEGNRISDKVMRISAPAVSTKEYHHFKEMLLDLDMSTPESSKKSMEEILERAPANSTCEITGEREHSSLPYSHSDRGLAEKRVNILGSTMVRKKKKV